MKQRLSVNILATKYNGDSRMCVHWYFAKHFLELSYHFLSKSNACIFKKGFPKLSTAKTIKQNKEYV